MRQWYWKNAADTWFFEARYGAKVLMLNGTKKMAIEAGAKEKLPDVIEAVMAAAHAGELDKALLATKRNALL